MENDRRGPATRAGQHRPVARSTATKQRSRPLRKGRSRTQTAPSLLRFIGIVFRRNSATKSLTVHFPARSLSLSGPAWMFSLWSSTEGSTSRRAAGDSLTLRTESRATRSMYQQQSWVRIVLFLLQPIPGREATSSSAGSVVSRSGLM